DENEQRPPCPAVVREPVWPSDGPGITNERAQTRHGTIRHGPISWSSLLGRRRHGQRYFFSCRRRPPRRSAVRHGPWDRRGFSAERAGRFSWGGSHTRHWSGSRYAPNGHPLESTKSIVR